jgi:tetratricopeptide (TPR) repeat protein
LGVKFLNTPAKAVASIRSLISKGAILCNNNNRNGAIPLFRKAYRLSLRYNQEYYAVDAAHMLGLFEASERQLSWNKRALSLAKNSKKRKTRMWLASLYNNIGWNYFDLKRYRKALESFELSLFFRKKRRSETFNARWAIGRVYRALNEIENGLRIQRALLAEVRQRKLGPDGHIYEELAECLLAAHRRKESAPYFRQAYRLLSANQWLRANEPSRLERLRKLGKVHKGG